MLCRDGAGWEFLAEPIPARSPQLRFRYLLPRKDGVLIRLLLTLKELRPIRWIGEERNGQGTRRKRKQTRRQNRKG